jgi:hypothetical protein
MGATADVCLAEGGKPSFDLPNPRNRGPSEMRMETRMASRLGIDRGGLVLGPALPELHLFDVAH